MGRFGKYNNPSRKSRRKPDYTERCIIAGKGMLIDRRLGYGVEAPICPKCGQAYSEPPALSREDNKTAICPDCGLKEALQDFARAERR